MTTSSSFLLGLLFAAVTLQNVTSFSISTPRQRATSSPVSRINKFPAALALHAISTPIETETQYAKMQRTGKAANVVIIGGGPAGLASAIMLARRGYTNVKVFDRLPEPSAPDDASVWNDFETGRNYNIGVSGRGQKALAKLDVLDKIDSFSAKCIGRLEWSPETAGEPKETISDRAFNPKIIQRERLASCLLDEIRTKYKEAVTVKYLADCTHVEWKQTSKEDEVCHLKISQKLDRSSLEEAKSIEWIEESPFVIGADGAQSAVRSAMEEDKYGGFYVKKYDDKNVRVYRTIPLHFPKGSNVDKLGKKWRGDLNYSVRTKSDINIDALPTKEGPYYGVVLFRPWDERFSEMKTGADAKAFFDEVLPMFSSIVRDGDLERFAQQPDSKLPRFSYVGPILHRGRTTCLLGDCIHTVKPYFGVGVNSALEDVIVLDSALESCKDDVPSALEKFSALRASDASAVVKMSERLDGGFFSFVLPLIVDSIFHKLMPKIFSPNTIKAIQDPNKTFTQVKLRKRIDRVLQFALGISIFALIGKSFIYLFGLSRIVSAKKPTVKLSPIKVPFFKIPAIVYKKFPFLSR